jgi:hypothetical protein
MRLIKDRDQWLAAMNTAMMGKGGGGGLTR